MKKHDCNSFKQRKNSLDNGKSIFVGFRHRIVICIGICAFISCFLHIFHKRFHRRQEAIIILLLFIIACDSRKFLCSFEFFLQFCHLHINASTLQYMLAGIKIHYALHRAGHLTHSHDLIFQRFVGKKFFFSLFRERA